MARHLPIGCEDRGNEMQAGKGLSAPRHNRGSATGEVALYRQISEMWL